MRFWDTSAIIPLLVEEHVSAQIDKLFLEDALLVVWWGTSIECISAVTRLEREGRLSHQETEEVVARLTELRETWREIQPAGAVKQVAERILRLHPLRSQDAQQLSACILANRDQSLEFVTLDERLRTAARKEGLQLAF